MTSWNTLYITISSQIIQNALEAKYLRCSQSSVIKLNSSRYALSKNAFQKLKIAES